MKHLTIKHFKENNISLVAVPLGSSGKKAVLNEEDFDNLILMGVSPVWSYSQEQVLVRNKKKSLSVVRLLVDAEAGTHVRYRDGDSTNLRRSNLVIADGSSKYRTRDLFTNEFAKCQWTLTHIERQ
jgi:hypothetical protein